MSTNDEYFLWRNEQREGPFTIEQITTMWDAHQIDGDTLMARNESKFTSAIEWIFYIREAQRLSANPPKPPRFTMDQRDNIALIALVVFIFTSIFYGASFFDKLIKFNP